MTPEDQLRTYGLTLDDAEALGIDILSGPTTASYGKNFAAVPSLQFNYRTFSARPTGFFRVRYLDPVTNPKKPGKFIRYQQPSGTIPEVYMPSNINWREISTNPSQQIILTEGEGKACCAAKLGLTCAALGGVDSFSAPRRGIELVEPLPRFSWKDRSVVICFDSDVDDNPNVIRAQTRLASTLTARGARVVIVKIPPPPADDIRTKWGLDDFLLSPGHGIEGFEELLEAAMAPSESVELFTFNSEFAAIMKPASVVSMDEGILMDPHKFQSFHAANRFYFDLQVKAGKVHAVRVPTAPRWLKWEGRRQYRKLVYLPGESETIISSEGKQDLNLWPGWGVEPVQPTHPDHLGPWNELLEFVFISEPRVRTWFEQWCAYPMQVPGGKLFSYVLLWSPLFGIGKTLVPYILMDIYGRDGKYGEGNSKEIKSKDLAGGDNHNTWQKCKQFIYGDEINAKETRQGGDFIKNLITAEHVEVNEKFIQKYSVANLINYMFSSNYPDAMFFDVNDRRPLIHEIWGPKQSDSWYRRLADWRAAGGAKYVFWHLLHLNMDGFEPKFSPPDTSAKRNMARLSMTDAAMWLDAVKDDPVSMLGMREVPADKAKNCDLWTTDQLLKMYDPLGAKRLGLAGMGKQLASLGYRPVLGGSKLFTIHGTVRPVAIRNVSKWSAATLGEVREHWEKWHGK